MYHINDYVNYSTQGICKIADVCSVSFGRDKSPKDYYILKPINKDCSQIFVPLDNDKLLEKMRPILSAEEIDGIILSIKDKDMPWIDDRKEREIKYREILTQRNETELLLLAKCLYFRSINSPKGLSSWDSGILKHTETIIAEEFSFSLNIRVEKIGEYIREKLGVKTFTYESET